MHICIDSILYLRDATFIMPYYCSSTEVSCFSNLGVCDLENELQLLASRLADRKRFERITLNSLK